MAFSSPTLYKSDHLKGHCHQYLDNFEKQKDIF